LNTLLQFEHNENISRWTKRAICDLAQKQSGGHFWSTACSFLNKGTQIGSFLYPEHRLHTTISTFIFQDPDNQGK